MSEQLNPPVQLPEATSMSDRLARIRNAVATISDTTELTGPEGASADQAIMAVKTGRIATALDMVGDDPDQLQQLALNPMAPQEEVTVLTDEQRQLVTDNLDLVSHVVFQVTAGFPKHVDKGDLAAAGTMGLVDAATRFDKEQGVGFDRFAARRIRGAILDHVRGYDWVPRSVRREARIAKEAEQRLAAKNGCSPSYQELATELDMPIEDIMQIKEKEYGGVLLSIDHEVSGDDEDLTLADVLADSKNNNPLLELEGRELIAIIRDAVALLPERNHYVTRAYFFEGKTSTEIAKELGVTESRISQLWAEAAEMIRDALNAQYDEGPSPEEKYGAGSLVARRRAKYASNVALKTNWKDRLSVSS